MSTVITIIFTTIGLGAVLAIPGVGLSWILEKRGINKSRYATLIVFSMFLVFLTELLWEDISFLFLVIVIPICSFLGTYNMQLFWALTERKVNYLDSSDKEDINEMD